MKQKDPVEIVSISILSSVAERKEDGEEECWHQNQEKNQNIPSWCEIHRQEIGNGWKAYHVGTEIESFSLPLVYW